MRSFYFLMYISLKEEICFKKNQGMKNFKTKDLMIVISAGEVTAENQFNCDGTPAGIPAQHCTHLTLCSHVSGPLAGCGHCTHCTVCTVCTAITVGCFDTAEPDTTDEPKSKKTEELHALKTTILKLQQKHSNKIAPDALVAN
jgi:hypothetical protein